MDSRYEIITTENGYDIVDATGEIIDSYDRESFFDMLVANTNVRAALDRVLEHTAKTICSIADVSVEIDNFVNEKGNVE